MAKTTNPKSKNTATPKKAATPKRAATAARTKAPKKAATAARAKASRPTATPPIHDVESIDVLGKRKEGGVDLWIVVDARLEDTDAHRELLGAKLNTYLATIALADFQVEMGRGPFRIIVTSKVAGADPAFEAWLRGLAPTIQEHGAELVVELPRR